MGNTCGFGVLNKSNLSEINIGLKTAYEMERYSTGGQAQSGIQFLHMLVNQMEATI